MYVDEIAMRDFRAIANSRVSLTHPLTEDAAYVAPSNLNLVVGTNGSGKSSVLKAIAAAFTLSRGARLPRSSAGWPRIGGAGDTEVQIRTSASGELGTRFGQLTLHISQAGRASVATDVDAEPGTSNDSTPAAVFAAYGPQRIGDRSAALDQLDPTSGRAHLLAGDTVLAPITEWLPQANHRAQAVAIVNALLPDDVRCLEAPSDDGHLFAQRDLPLPIAALSDGIQSFLAWIGDLLWRIDAIAQDDLTDVPGIVLVDEIDQRLHPTWQRSILNRLGTSLPNLQFVCTAHSPLLLSGLRRQNLLLVEPAPELPGTGATAVRRLTVEDVYGYSTDQILESSYFGLSSSRSDPFWDELRAIAHRASTTRGDPKAALEFMRRLADPGRRRPDDES